MTGAGSLIGAAGHPLIGKGLELLKRITYKNKSFEEKRNDLKCELKDQNRPWIVFFIDDVDRLSDAEIALVFQLVKNIADFPKIIYVLAYDRDVVAVALDAVQRGHGEEYLHKVVQLTVSVPKSPTDALGRMLWDKIAWFLANRSVENIDMAHLREIWRCVRQGYARTPRDCSRIYNAFMANYLVCGKECDMGDLFAVAVLNLAEPQLYSFIYQHEYTLMARKPDAAEWEENPDVLMSIARAMEAQFTLQEKPWLHRMLAEMFPDFAEKVRWAHSAEQDSSCLIPQRICQAEYFERYFQMAVPETAVPADQTVQILQIEETETLYDEMKALRQENRLQPFLRQAAAACRFGTSEAVPIDAALLVRFMEALSSLRLMREGSGWDDITASEQGFDLEFAGICIEKSGDGFVG